MLWLLGRGESAFFFFFFLLSSLLSSPSRRARTFVFRWRRRRARVLAIERGTSQWSGRWIEADACAWFRANSILCGDFAIKLVDQPFVTDKDDPAEWAL